ncbi:uncharacterized protein J8A68_004100 [[Candida] subhashii]|uniref:Uncharacterized protein n=1 Tax=[Candida] subhashii TaxID=561895 RepID=A0A8J5UXF9_9ASCO|nr:uncharacterized protein J8A68_004100 [[Candida] subhashii]KAG7662329.1 hypothetical protein J8A68_004100 [[Candida] subhashii]
MSSRSLSTSTTTTTSTSSANNKTNNSKSNTQFQPYQLQTIANLPIDELTSLESNISQEFKQLSQEYLRSRLNRINAMIEKLIISIRLAGNNDKNWFKIFNFEIETINNIKTNFEDLILESLGVVNNNRIDILKSLDEYETELKEIFKSLQSPLDFDDMLNNNKEKKTTQSSLDKLLPFPYLFNQVFQPHKDLLNMIINEKNYQAELIKNNSKGNSVIIWKQYYHDMLRKKQELIQSTNDELYELYQEFHHMNIQRKYINHANKIYFRSVVNPMEVIESTEQLRNEEEENDADEQEQQQQQPKQEEQQSITKVNSLNTKDLSKLIKYNHDSDYVNLDTRFLPHKNRIELTTIRKSIIDKTSRICKVPHMRKMLIHKTYPKEENLILSKRPCEGLDSYQDDDIDQDIWLIRSRIQKGVQTERIDGDEEEEEEEDGEDAEGGGSEESDMEEEEESEEGEDEDMSSEDDSEYIDETEYQELYNLSPEQRELRNEYKRLLNSSSSSSNPRNTTLKWRSIPPLEKFQIL